MMILMLFVIAVLLTIGAEKWSTVSETFALLSKDFQWKTRRTLAYSLHEIARILGEKSALHPLFLSFFCILLSLSSWKLVMVVPSRLTEESLLTTFDLFLHDLDEVKLGIITHFADFLEVPFFLFSHR